MRQHQVTDTLLAMASLPAGVCAMFKCASLLTPYTHDSCASYQARHTRATLRYMGTVIR